MAQVSRKPRFFRNEHIFASTRANDTLSHHLNKEHARKSFSWPFISAKHECSKLSLFPHWNTKFGLLECTTCEPKRSTSLHQGDRVLRKLRNRTLSHLLTTMGKNHTTVTCISPHGVFLCRSGGVIHELTVTTGVDRVTVHELLLARRQQVVGGEEPCTTAHNGDAWNPTNLAICVTSFSVSLKQKRLLDFPPAVRRGLTTRAFCRVAIAHALQADEDEIKRTEGLIESDKNRNSTFCNLSINSSMNVRTFTNPVPFKGPPPPS